MKATTIKAKVTLTVNIPTTLVGLFVEKSNETIAEIVKNEITRQTLGWTEQVEVIEVTR